jgi:hypothetical protein
VTLDSLPQTVEFKSDGKTCIAGILFGGAYMLNMATCVINFDQKPAVQIEYLPHGTRILINGGKLWFDTSEQSAAEIEYLFQTGKAHS